MEVGDLIYDGGVFLPLGAEDLILQVRPPNRAIGGHYLDLELVYFKQLGGLGLGRARHARQLAVHAEQVLQGNGGHRLRLLLHLDAFLRLQRLVQSVGEAAPRLRPTR